MALATRDSAVFSGASGLASFPTAAAAADGVSLAEVLRYMSEKQLPRVVNKNTGSMASGYDTGDSPVTLYTVTGDVLITVFGVVNTAVTSASNSGTLEVGVTGGTATLLAQEAADGTAFAINNVWVDASATAKVEAIPGSGAYSVIAGGLDVILTIGTNNMTAGDIDFYALWLPLSSDGAVVAA